MKVTRGQLNPTMYWGVHAHGFAFGDKVLWDPEIGNVKNAVIDSGTAAIYIPHVLFNNIIDTLAEDFKDEHDVDLICTRDNMTQELDHCYFNNTNCMDLVDEY